MDRFGNNALEAFDLRSSTNGLIHNAADTDWFRVQLQAGTTYRFDQTAMESTQSHNDRSRFNDPLLSLWNGTSMIAQDDDGHSDDNYSARIDFTPTRSGTYWLEAAAFDGRVSDAGSPYEMTIREIEIHPEPEAGLLPAVTEPTPVGSAPERPERPEFSGTGNGNISGNGNITGSFNGPINVAPGGTFIVNTGTITGFDLVTGIGGRERYQFTNGSDTLTIQGDGRDRLKGFDPDQDRIQLDADQLMDGGLTTDEIAVAETSQERRQLLKASDQLVYFEPRGQLLYDANGDSRGVGEGGTIAKLDPGTELTDQNVVMV